MRDLVVRGKKNLDCFYQPSASNSKQLVTFAAVIIYFSADSKLIQAEHYVALLGLVRQQSHRSIVCTYEEGEVLFGANDLAVTNRLPYLLIGTLFAPPFFLVYLTHLHCALGQL